MPLLILLVIVTTTLALFLMLQTRSRFWLRAGVAYIALGSVNLLMALNLWMVAQPVRTLTIAALLMATLFLLPAGVISALRRAQARPGEDR
ncbi:hypothetical protein IMZ29_09555 [Achromobacter sp. GG226]|uniref:hypothetical protein n=1 Tax=Verticiella alkaliphila TaxID=2779529 RepID=UPI001C0CDEB3|nr:hypothetical protein [Verticiella sp. GG226]MBU4610766.1 hypothetical protein [Verticiella sp. GG226]